MKNLKEIIESILFVSGDAVDYLDIAEKLELSVKDIEKAVKELQNEKEVANSGVLVQTFNGKAQLRSNSDYAEQVETVLNPIKEKSLTRAVLEVAAIIAYKQPVTRLDIEHIRGVSSDYSINALMENNLIEVVGRKDAIGKPLLYGTTDEFLKRFNMESISELPDYDELINRIQVIKTENSLFDFSNIPSSELNEEGKNFELNIETEGTEEDNETNPGNNAELENPEAAVAIEEQQAKEIENILEKVANENTEDTALSDLNDEELDKFLEEYKKQTELKDSAISAQNSEEFSELKSILNNDEDDDDDFLSGFDTKYI